MNQMERTIYCLSGLGADDRLFKNLNIEGYNLVTLTWPPYKQTDNLVSYAFKLSEQIKEPNPILLGVSYGGMLAVEIANKLKAKKLFLVSSILTAKDFPFYYRWANELSLVSIIPDDLLTQPSELVDYIFGVETEEDAALLHDYVKNNDPNYLRWAIKSIFNWDNDEFPFNFVHIHGTNDRLIPIPQKVHYRIQDGGHMMILNTAEEISKIINEELGAIV